MEKLNLSTTKLSISSLSIEKSATNSDESIFFSRSALSALISAHYPISAETRALDTLKSYEEDFLIHFTGLVEFYHLDQTFLKRVYMVDMESTINAFCILKYHDEIIRYLSGIKSKQKSFTHGMREKCIKCVTQARADIVKLLLTDDTDFRETAFCLREITNSTENIYTQFAYCKNLKIFEGTRKILEDLQKLNSRLATLKAHISLEATRITIDELIIYDDDYSNRLLS